MLPEGSQMNRKHETGSQRGSRWNWQLRVVPGLWFVVLTDWTMKHLQAWKWKSGQVYRIKWRYEQIHNPPSLEGCIYVARHTQPWAMKRRLESQQHESDLGSKGSGFMLLAPPHSSWWAAFATVINSSYLAKCYEGHYLYPINNYRSMTWVNTFKIHGLL